MCSIGPPQSVEGVSTNLPSPYVHRYDACTVVATHPDYTQPYTSHSTPPLQAPPVHFASSPISPNTWESLISLLFPHFSNGLPAPLQFDSSTLWLPFQSADVFSTPSPTQPTLSPGEVHVQLTTPSSQGISMPQSSPRNARCKPKPLLSACVQD
jgi:hypothetical protein